MKIIVQLIFYKVRAQWHKQGIKDISIKLRSLANSSSTQSIKKGKNIQKKKWGHKPNLVNPHEFYVNPIGWYEKKINNTNGCLKYGV